MISGRYAGHLQRIYQTGLPPAEMMAKALDTVFEFWKNDRTYYRITSWAFLEGRTNPAKSESALTAGLAEYIKALQKQGVFPKDMQPKVFLSMIIGPIHFWFRYKTQFAGIPGINSETRDIDDLFISNFKKMLLRFFREKE